MAPRKRLSVPGQQHRHHLALPVTAHNRTAQYFGDLFPLASCVLCSTRLPCGPSSMLPPSIPLTEGSVLDSESAVVNRSLRAFLHDFLSDGLRLAV